MTNQQQPRLDRNAPGDWYTTGECMACGAPEVEAPDLFALLTDDNDETYFVRQPITERDADRACRAAKACCVTAIRYGGRDPGIIRRLGNSGEYCDYVIDSRGNLHVSPPWHPPSSPAPRRPWWRFWDRDRAS
jgi:ferredoxin